MSKRLAILPAKALLAVLALALSLSAVELSLNRLYPINELSLEIDELHLLRLRPGSQTLFRHQPEDGGHIIHVKVNSRGFRGDELSATNRETRVVVYGDSFIQANFSAQAHTFSHRLGREMARRLGRRVEVVNAGVVSYGPDQISRRIDTELDLLDPDLVIVAVYAGNDFGDLLRNKLYRIDSEGNLAENQYVIDPWTRRAFDPSVLRNRLASLRLFHDVRRRIRLSWAGTLTDAEMDPIHRSLELSRAEYAEYVLEGNNRVTELLADHYDADIAIYPGSASAVYKQHLLELVVLRIRDTLSSRTVPWLLMVIPSPVDVCRNFRTQVDAGQFPTYRRTNLTNAVAAIARRNGLRYLDLFPHFASVDATDLYFQADGHWNDTGQLLAARLAAGPSVAALIDGTRPDRKH